MTAGVLLHGRDEVRTEGTSSEGHHNQPALQSQSSAARTGRLRLPSLSLTRNRHRCHLALDFPLVDDRYGPSLFPLK